jgi:hypothetical protein
MCVTLSEAVSLATTAAIQPHELDAHLSASEGGLSGIKEESSVATTHKWVDDDIVGGPL